MKTTMLGVTVLFTCCVWLVSASLDQAPDNMAVLAGSTIVLSCSTRRSPPTSRVMWTEFSSGPGGSLVSDNKGIVPSHPNAARYSILGADNEYHLQISNVTVADGGLYMCQDINAGPPDNFRVHAQLIVLESDPKCDTFIPATGNILRDVSYAGECEIHYKGNLSPVMDWSGPEPYITNTSNPVGTVWSYVRFIAQEDMEGGIYTCHTHFLPVASVPGYANNTPAYEFRNSGPPLIVVWGPQDMEITPDKVSYVVGDVLTCNVDAKPTPNFRWQNMRTLGPLIPGQTFTIEEDLLGFNQTMRCNAFINIEGSLHTLDGFQNVDVPAITTPTSPPTTPVPTTPAADAPCDDLTGRWSSTNPDAIICLEVDFKGNMLTLLRNGTDLFFIAGNGKTIFNDYRHIGFTGMWPGDVGIAGFSGECHKCLGTEVILLSGLSRNKYNAPDCGVTDGTGLTKLYVLTRSGPPCRGQTLDVRGATAWQLEQMGITPLNPSFNRG